MSDPNPIVGFDMSGEPVHRHPAEPRPDLVVEEWRITGEPGQGYPHYEFVYRSNDPRWNGQAELEARIQHAAMADGGTWEDGPHLQHRTVTYGPWGDREQPMPRPGTGQTP